MKFHLPKKLMLAILAAMIPTVWADAVVVTPGAIIGKDANGNSQDYTINGNDQIPDAWENYSEATGAYGKYAQAILKDGVDSTLTISNLGSKDESVIVKSPLYIREGCATISDSYIITQAWTPVNQAMIQVAGNNASLTLKNTSYIYQSWESSIAIGGPDGSGAMTFDNSEIRVMTIWAGLTEQSTYNGNYVYNATTESTDSDSKRYSNGVYRTVENPDGTTRNFGVAEINVTNGSKLHMLSNVELGEGVLTVDNASIDVGGAVFLGRMNSCTSELNVINGGVITGSSTSEGSLYTADRGYYATPSKVEVNVKGENSKIELGKTINLAAPGTTLNITEGGTVSAKQIDFSRDDNESGDVKVKIDKDSSLKGEEYIVIRTRATVTNAGSIDTAALYMTAGSALTLTEGTGTLNTSYILMESGSTTSYEVHGAASENAPITLNAGMFEMEQDATFELIFSDDYVTSIDSNASSISILIASGLAADSSIQGTLSHNGFGAVKYDLGELTWTTEDGKLYATGELLYKTVITTDKAELNENISDTPSGDTVLVEAKDQELTISGDNTHTGGTRIENAHVTLGSDTALGTGPVASSGTSSISTSEGVTATLTSAIQNSGALTMSGNYNGANLGTISFEDTYINISGEEGDNGFFRKAYEAIQVVDNVDGASLTVAEGTTVTNKDGQALTLHKDGHAHAGSPTDYTTYFIKTDDHEVTTSDISEASGNQTTTIDMSAGTLYGDGAYAIDVNATGGTINMINEYYTLTGTVKDTTINADLGSIEATLSGSTSVNVQSKVSISGDNSHTGDTTINRGSLSVRSEKALGKSKVILKNHGTLDLGGFAITNAIDVQGCTLMGAGAYQGDMTVSGDLSLADDTTANSITLVDGGNITGSKLSTKAITVGAGNNGNITSDLVLMDGATVTLAAGTTINVTGSVTLGKDIKLVLQGDQFQSGDKLITYTGTLTGDLSNITLDYNGEELALTSDAIVLGDGSTGTPGEEVPGIEVPGEEEPDEEEPGEDIFEPDSERKDLTTLLVQSNWGIMTTSRAFVDTVKGQHNNMGCIANGRGTAWAAALGSSHKIDGSGSASGSDITLFGAAVGADMKVGKRSSLGLALGYADTEVSPTNLANVDQESSYVALYGDHGLKKFANNSCLSLNWVAAYGNTESKAMGISWEQDSLQVNTRLTWNKKVSDKLAVNVFGGLEYFASDSDSVANYKSGSIQNLRGEIGVGAQYSILRSQESVAPVDKGAATPACDRLVVFGEISYINDMVRHNPVAEIKGIRNLGSNPGRQGMGLEAGAMYRLNTRWTTSAVYSFNAMDDSNEHAINVGASYTF